MLSALFYFFTLLTTIVEAISSPSNASAIAYLRALLQAPDGRISYKDLSRVPEGANDAHHSGWVVLRKSDTTCITHFPSLFHRYQCSWLLSGRFELPAKIEAMDHREFITAIIRSFSPMAMRNAERDCDSQGKRSIPDAHYQHELYRAVYELTGGRGIWLSPEFGTSSLSPKAGRIDFLVGGSKGWGIEILRKGDRMSENPKKIERGRAYGSWIPAGVMKEHIVIEFCSEPRDHPGEFRQFDSEAFFILIYLVTGTYNHFSIEDCVHGELVAEGYLKE